jgi:hypothetical protein
MMSMTSQQNPNAPSPDPDAALSERQYLQQEQARASAAMGHAWKRAQNNLIYGANPRRAIKEHPWITLGSVLVLGAGVAAVVFYEKKHPREKSPISDPVTDKATERRNSRRKRWLLKGLSLLRPAVMSIVSIAISATLRPPSTDGEAAQPVSSPDRL